MANYYVDSNAGAAEYSNKAWSVGQFMVPAETDTTTNHLVAKGWIWECTTGGTSSATPTWPASVTDDVTTVTEAGGVVWTARLPDNWTHALPGLYWLGVSTSVVPAATDFIYVAHNHQSKIYANSNTFYASGSVVSVTSGTTTPQAGAEERLNAARYLTVYGSMLYVYGIKYTIGTGSASAGGLSIATSNSAASRCVFDNCTFVQNNTGTGNNVLGAADTGTPAYIELRNCVFQAGGAGQHLTIGGTGYRRLVNCSFTGTSLSVVFRLNTGRNAPNFEAIGCDFSNATTLLAIDQNDDPAFFKLVNCKIPSTPTSGTHQGIGSSYLEMHACSTADSVMDYYLQCGEGVIQESTAIYLTTGGSQMKEASGTLTSYSLELNPSTAVSKAFPLYSPWVSKFVGSTGSKTFSLKIAYDDATALKDCECWLEVEYYKNTTDPLSSVEVSAPVVSGTISRDILAAGTNLTNTSEAWTGTSGWSNKKTATLIKTVTVNQQGYVRCRVAVAKDVTTYVDQVIGVA